MDRYERAALDDFVLSVIWPTRTPATVTSPGGQQDFTVYAPAGGWAMATDTPMAWINGQRVTGAITWLSPTSVRLPAPAPLGARVIILVQPGAGSGYLPRDGGVSMLDVLNMANFQIENLGESTQGHHAVRRDEVASLVATLVGGNYVAKAGDQMAGALLGAAAALLTNPAALIRRDMAVLNDGSQDIVGKLRMATGQQTIDTDSGLTLTTKNWVEAYVQQALANTQAPNQTWQKSTPGIYTFTIGAGGPDGTAATVRKVWIYCKGAKGGPGGGQPSGGGLGANPGVDGGLGGIISASIPVINGSVITVTVGGNGISGISSLSDAHKYPASGGGGGGATQAAVGTDTLTGGGGGGGSGRGGRDNQSGGRGGAGGAGGKQGGAGSWGAQGGLPGNTIDAAGGVGGAGLTNGGANVGGVGTGAATAGFNTNDTFPFQSVTDPNAGTGIGLAIIKWFQ